MGIPYSKQINAAFDQVTPLVASGFEVLETTRNISVLLAGIQVLTAIFQLFTIFTLIALLICVNPDLNEERKALVTPVVRYLASWVMPGSEGRWILTLAGRILLCVWLCVCAAAAYYYSREWDGSGPPLFPSPQTFIEAEPKAGDDVDALKKGQSNQ